jgi:hypothetical protein
VTGDRNNPGGYNGTPIKTSEIALSAANKIVQGDWPWHPNRGWDDRKSQWHNYKGRSLSVVAFGDGYAEAFKFPTIKDTDPYWTKAPDPSHLWW